jgi:hypothetical protein
MGKRDPFLVERDLERYRKRYQTHLFPSLENTPDLRRGEIRLAAEVATLVILGVFIPPDQLKAFEAARLKAYETLRILAKG